MMGAVPGVIERPGGLALAPPRGWQDRIRKFIDAFPSKIDEYEDLLTQTAQSA